MAFADELAAAVEKHRPRNKCCYEVARESLTKSDFADFESAVENQTITSAAISTALKRAYGVSIQGQSIARHRRGDCQCSR